jgi:TrmH family RNA methyltransferase
MLVRSKLKYIQTLGQKKFRDRDRVFIAEGTKLVEELIAAHTVSIRELLAVEEWIESHSHLLRGVNVTAITEEELDKISQLSSPNKVFVIADQFRDPGSIVTRGKITLALDAIRDPGNMGTILRIADWFGIEQVVCSGDSVDIYNPKVVQASMGSLARVRVFYRELSEWLPEQEGISIFGTGLEGRDITKMEKIGEGIILIGNESKGLDKRLMEMSRVRITIPKKGEAESLNAAVAAGIILSHLV